MKRRFFMASVLLLFGFMLAFPRTVFHGASAGLMLWFQVILPTLLPFIIMTNLLIATRAASLISRITGPLIGRLFGVSEYGSFAVLTGFLCGYPMGSKVTADLLDGGYISQAEGRYLLSFCNNTSPLFIISFVVWHNLKSDDLTLPALVILTAAPVLCSFLFRRYYKIYNRSASSHTSSMPASPSSSSGMLDDCIMNGFEAITKVGGYMMLFSIFLAFADHLSLTHPFFTLLAFPSLEMTNGIARICSICQDFDLRFILALALTSFGGWCSIAQTRCMIQHTDLSIFPYIIQKLITAGVTSLFAYLYLRLQ